MGGAVRIRIYAVLHMGSEQRSRKEKQPDAASGVYLCAAGVLWPGSCFREWGLERQCAQFESGLVLWDEEFADVLELV